MAGRYDHMNSKSTAVASHINVYVRSYHCNTIYISGYVQNTDKRARV
jgi:hypothetical protein